MFTHDKLTPHLSRCKFAFITSAFVFILIGDIVVTTLASQEAQANMNFLAPSYPNHDSMDDLTEHDASIIGNSKDNDEMIGTDAEIGLLPGDESNINSSIGNDADISIAGAALTSNSDYIGLNRHQQMQDYNQTNNDQLPDDADSSHPHLVTTDSQDPSNYYSTNNLPNDDEKIYISRELVREICHLDRGSLRSEPLNNTYLKNCKRYKLENLLSNDILMSIMHRKSEDCEKILNEFIQLDELIDQFDTMFRNLLMRYNCHNGYSVKWNCDDCKTAYKDWLCATNLPFHMNGERIMPCISFCERVEQRCPYLHPITKEQYGGQPVFICRDPNIPFIIDVTPDIPYGDAGKCYELCHLSNNITELVIDSLSKNEFHKCQDTSSIAEGVRNDPYYCGPKMPITVSDEYQLQENATTSLFIHDKPMPSKINNDGVGKASKRCMFGGKGNKQSYAHNRKLSELHKVLNDYKNQPKSHKFGHHIEHASIDHHHFSSIANKQLI